MTPYGEPVSTAPTRELPPNTSHALATYTITQSLAGKLYATPTSTMTKAFPCTFTEAYTLSLQASHSRRNTIDVSLHRSPASSLGRATSPVGSCAITPRAKSISLHFPPYGPSVSLQKHSRAFHRDDTTYTLDMPHHGVYTWAHDDTVSISASHGAKRFKLVDEASSAVLARYGGSAGGAKEFGVLEVYHGGRVGQNEAWQALCLLTAICIHVAEEKRSEAKERRDEVLEKVGLWGGLLTLGAPVRL